MSSSASSNRRRRSRSSDRRRSHHNLVDEGGQHDATEKRRKFEILSQVFEDAYRDKYGLLQGERDRVLERMQLRFDDDDKSELHKKSKLWRPYLNHKDSWAILFVEKVLSAMEPTDLREQSDNRSRSDDHSLALDSADLRELMNESPPPAQGAHESFALPGGSPTGLVVPDLNDGGEQRRLSSLTGTDPSSSVGAVCKKRAIPMDGLHANDTDVYTFIARRFHPCFLPTSTKERLVRDLFRGQTPDCISEDQLLSKLVEEELRDITWLWKTIGIPFVQLGDKGITFALQEKCGTHCGDVILEMFEHSVKPNGFNQVTMAKVNNHTQKLSPDDKVLWHSTSPGEVIAVPWLRSFVRSLLEVSQRAVTFVMGANLENASRVALRDSRATPGDAPDVPEEARDVPAEAIIHHTDALCLRISPTIGKFPMVVVKTNTCLIFCGNKPVAGEDVEVNQRNSGAAPKLFVDKVKSYKRGHFQGLLLGHHLDSVVGICINGTRSDDHIGTFPWTSLAAHVHGIDVDNLESLSVIGQWDDEDVQEDMRWPMPSYMIRKLGSSENGEEGREYAEQN